jgi:hypothetical protein
VDLVHFNFKPSGHAVVFLQEEIVYCDDRMSHTHDRFHETSDAVELSLGLTPGGRQLTTHVAQCHTY